MCDNFVKQKAVSFVSTAERQNKHLEMKLILSNKKCNPDLGNKIEYVIIHKS